MNEWLIVFIVLISITTLMLWVKILILGINLCDENNALGVVLLFISLNIFGLMIGLALLYNYRQEINFNKKELKNE